MTSLPYALAGLIGLLVIGCDSTNRNRAVPSAASVDPVRVDACWKQLGAQLRAGSDKCRDIERMSESSIVRAKKTTAAVRDLAAGIRAIPLEGVDPDLISLVERRIQHVQRTVKLLAKTERLIEERQALHAEANPDSIEVVVLQMLLSNAPASKDNGYREKAAKLGIKTDGLREEIEAYLEDEEKLDHEATSLQKQLAARYGRPFPTLTPSGDPEKKKYSDAELAALRKTWEGRAGEWGRMLLQETHPTGKYRASSLHNFEMNKDREGAVVVILCEWEGALTSSKYFTQFRAVIDKRRGLLELSVPQDTAVISIAAPNLLAGQAKLRDAIRVLR